ASLVSFSPGNIIASKLSWLSMGKPRAFPLQSIESCTLCSTLVFAFTQDSIREGLSLGLGPTSITGYEQPTKIANIPACSIASLITALLSIKSPTPSMLQTAAPLTWQKVQTEQLQSHSMRYKPPFGLRLIHE